jgi:hypothetical protein
MVAFGPFFSIQEFPSWPAAASSAAAKKLVIFHFFYFVTKTFKSIFLQKKNCHA